jgi:hypothetical protein
MSGNPLVSYPAGRRAGRSAAKRKRRVHSIKEELVRKSREAALTAVQVFNNPQVLFKSESFIVLMIISWTYLLHAYYRQQGVEYRYFETVNGRNRYKRTKSGDYKYWELTTCLGSERCPVDSATRKNLELHIELRNQIEHQMCLGLDDYLSGRYQACVLNYCHYLKMLFGEDKAIDDQLSFAIQLSRISKEQAKGQKTDPNIPPKLQSFIAKFDEGLTEDEFNDERYSYRLLFTRKLVNRRGQADAVIEFVDSNSEVASAVNKEYWFRKEVERKKYLPSQIIELMHQEGFFRFNMHHHTQLWQSEDAKNPAKGFGYQPVKTWYWYEVWVERVRQHCVDSRERYS